MDLHEVRLRSRRAVSGHGDVGQGRREREAFLRFAFDDNLGVPSDFSQRFECELVSFHDLGHMLAAFSDGSVDAMFAPCGALPYLQVQYDVLAQATFGSSRGRHIQSRLVVPANAAADVPAWPGGRIGCVNEYCTTSYWAPLMSMVENTPAGSTIDFRAAAGFTDMLSAVTDGRVDAAMVWDIVLTQHPDTSGRTREIFRRDGLPTPLILAAASFDTDGRETMRANLATYITSAPGFFNGFAAPDLDAIAAFARLAAAARDHYRLKPVQAA